MTIGDITFSNISKTYPGGIVALKDFSITIPSGKITAFIGANGSGKSTALKLLAGQSTPDSGTIDFLGVNPQEQTQQIRKNIGYITQDVGLDNEITGRESLSLFASLHGINGTRKITVVDQLANEYGLGEHLDKRVKSYSGGLKQRLHLTLSVIHNPAYLLLDEPTNSLDPEGKEYIWQKLSHYRDKSVIIVTHDLHEAAKYCDHVVLFHKGTVLIDGHPNDIIEKDKSIQLQINYEGLIKDQVKDQINTLEGLNRVSYSNNKILLSINEQIYDEQLVNSVLDNATIDITEVRKHTPDLSTAYFNLTGEIAQGKSTSINLKQKRKRK